jgi:TonB family protein
MVARAWVPIRQLDEGWLSRPSGYIGSVEAKWPAALCFSALLAQGQTDRVEKYRKELGQNPTSSEAHFWLGENLLEQKQFQAAANEFRQAVSGDLRPWWTEVWAYIYLAEIYDLTGQRERALNEYHIAKRTKDDYAGAQEFADVLLAQGPLLTYQLSSGLDRTVPPKAIEKIEPKYSDEARLASLEGAVRVRCEIGPDGSVRDVSLKRGLGLGLDERALEAVWKWKFAPGTFDGKPVTMETAVDVEFRLADKPSLWRLTGVEFRLPEGGSRPVIVKAPFPAGDHLSPRAEEAVQRSLSQLSFKATIFFEIDDRGVPRGFTAVGGLPELGEDAIAFLKNWRFIPGLKNGPAVAVGCKFDFVWGP